MNVAGQQKESPPGGRPPFRRPPAPPPVPQTNPNPLRFRDKRHCRQIQQSPRAALYTHPASFSHKYPGGSGAEPPQANSPQAAIFRPCAKTTPPFTAPTTRRVAAAANFSAPRFMKHHTFRRRGQSQLGPSPKKQPGRSAVPARPSRPAPAEAVERAVRDGLAPKKQPGDGLRTPNPSCRHRCPDSTAHDGGNDVSRRGGEAISGVADFTHEAPGLGHPCPKSALTHCCAM